MTDPESARALRFAKAFALVFLATFEMAGISASAQPLDSTLRDAAARIHSAAGAHGLILLGEMHGTREIPLLVASLVEAYARETPVILCLEVPVSEQAAIDRYFDSDGSAGARAALRQGTFWQVRGVQHDGRRNFDVLELIERMRALRHRGHRVAILAFDNAQGARVDSEARDEAMSVRLRAARLAQPTSRLIALAGNVHTMRRRPENAPAQMQRPMGSRLLDLDPFAVDISARAGQFWACLKQCGPQDAHPRAQSSGPSNDGVYDFDVVLQQLSVAKLLGTGD